MRIFFREAMEEGRVPGYGLIFYDFVQVNREI